MYQKCFMLRELVLEICGDALYVQDNTVRVKLVVNLNSDARVVGSDEQ